MTFTLKKTIFVLRKQHGTDGRADGRADGETDGRRDGPTEWWTDTTSYRDA